MRPSKHSKPKRMALILGAALAAHTPLTAANEPFKTFVEVDGANSTAPINILDVLKGNDPTQQYNTRYKPRAQWRDQLKVGLATENLMFYAHASKLGRIKTDNSTLNFWSDYAQKGFAPENGKSYRVNWDYLNLDAKGFGAQFSAIRYDALSLHIGANLGMVDSFDQRLIDGHVQRTGNTSTLNANIAKTSTTPFIPQLQSSAQGQATWFHFQLNYAQPQSPWQLMFRAPVLLGSARLSEAAFINTHLNYSQTNGLLKNNSQSPSIGSYGNANKNIKLPNFWDLNLEYAHSQSINPVLLVEGVDASAAVYLGNSWKSFFSAGTDLELLVDQEIQTFLVNVRSKGQFSAGVGISRLNTNAPVSFRFSYRY